MQPHELDLPGTLREYRPTCRAIECFAAAHTRLVYVSPDSPVRDERDIP